MRTTLDPKLQLLARKTMVDGLVNFDESKRLPRSDHQDRHRRRLGRPSSPTSNRCRTSIRGAWRWCSRSSDQSARIGLQPPRDPGGNVVKQRDIGIVPLEGVKWAKPAKGPAHPIKRVSEVLSPGDVIYVEPMEQKGEYRLRQVPEISGAMVVEDPHTGRVLAMVGGFSFDRKPVQPRHPGAAPAGLLVQAHRLCRRDR